MSGAAAIFLSLLALAWIVQGVRAVLGMRKLPRLGDVTPLADADCPPVSILFSARDEEQKLPQTLAAWLALDYPRYEVVAVNDRSTDGTGPILNEAAARDARLKVVHVTELPCGWLGKPHGLLRAYEASNGEWLIFTDADVRFAPDLVRRAVALARRENAGYLFLVGEFEVVGFWEKTIVALMGLLLMLLEPWQFANPRSRRSGGAGYFLMLHRTAYRAMGTHRRLAMAVVDDMKLGQLAKRSGVRCAGGVAEGRVRVRWHHGLWGSARNLEKNLFALCEFRVWLAALLMFGILSAFVLPVAALAMTTGWPQAFAAVAVAAPMLVAAAAIYRLGASRVSPLYGLTIPLGAFIFAGMLVNSTAKTLRRGGIVWRDTFYPLDELRKGMV